MDLRRTEVLRYLGYGQQPLDLSLEALITECIEEVVQAAEVKKAVYQVYPIEKTEQGIALVGTALVLEGASIQKHLEHCTHCYLLAATLGGQVEKLIRKSQVTGLSKSVILDACATEAIEVYCDQIELEIKRKAAQQNQHITGRYSPGYGDLPLQVQSKLLDALQAYKRIGLTVTAHQIMLPRKSVTACIGLSPVPVKGTLRGCGGCTLKYQCSYRKGGKACELFRETSE